jgi:hypothetical protein
MVAVGCRLEPFPLFGRNEIQGLSVPGPSCGCLMLLSIPGEGHGPLGSVALAPVPWLTGRVSSNGSNRLGSPAWLCKVNSTDTPSSLYR